MLALAANFAEYADEIEQTWKQDEIEKVQRNLMVRNAGKDQQVCIFC